jgi:hypothetical protein
MQVAIIGDTLFLSLCASEFISARKKKNSKQWVDMRKQHKQRLEYFIATY